MDADKEALLQELDNTIEAVRASRGTCAGHGALARGIAMALRCHRAQLVARSKGAGSGAVAGGFVAGILLALQHWLSK